MKRFPGPVAAGRELAASLQQFECSRDTIVLGIVSGGVAVASEVARELHIPLDLLFIRRLLAPTGPQDVLCAVNVAGTLVLDDRLPSLLTQVETATSHFVADAIQHLSERECFCRARQPPVALRGKQIILVDNGIHTGSTISIAVRAVRKLDADRVVVAVPVADQNSRVTVEMVTDKFVCLLWPEKFGHVGLCYEEFVRPSEEQIRELYLAGSQIGEEMLNE